MDGIVFEEVYMGTSTAETIRKFINNLDHESVDVTINTEMWTYTGFSFSHMYNFCFWLFNIIINKIVLDFGETKEVLKMKP